MNKIDSAKLDLVVTESILGKRLKKVFDEQNERNLKTFLTKVEFEERLDKLENTSNIKMDKILVGLDKVYAKLDKKEQESAMHGYQHKIAEDRLANHDKRIEKLEKAVA